MQHIGNWLSLVDSLPLECDGMTRVISALLQRDGIEHSICIGRLRIEGVGQTPTHWWIVLPDGRICDYRARMWLGDAPMVPHGVFPLEEHHGYLADSRVEALNFPVSEFTFMVLAWRPITDFPTYVEYCQKKDLR